MVQVIRPSASGTIFRGLGFSANNRFAFYMGDDERFDYIYKYVSSGDYEEMLASGVSPLSDGTLYVADIDCVRMFDAAGTLRDAYFGAVAAELRKSGRGFVEFTVVVEREFTRLLSLIRHDGVLSKTNTKTYGPFPVDQHADAS